ncbi:MAG: DEAD/DEAH box helicase [Acidimicrobiia bacterium]
MSAHTAIDRYLDDLPFSVDAFQETALRSIAHGRSVVVTAPTGAGKTVIAEGAIAVAREGGHRAFYTTPIKALSNQKYQDLVAQLGVHAVGLLTGDNVINGDASVVVMTTEVLRNMIYEGSRGLDDLTVVVLDEVHYLADRARGSVWEEVIIHLPSHITLVCLSATIANPEEFTSWIRARRGNADLVVEAFRPVPLTTMYAYRDRHAGNATLMHPMFTSHGKPNPHLARLTRPTRDRHRRLSVPRRTEIVDLLAAEELLPAIYFVFSRKGCDHAARQIAASSLGLTTRGEQAEIRAVAERHTAAISERDLAVLGYGGWLETLEQGAAPHHAGLIPAFKEAVEELFLRGLVKVVVATETLALGINMPARTVVLDSLSKFTGEGHDLLMASDFTQLTGRAGRRGIDEHGTAVVLYSPHVPFDRATGIAGSGSNPLRSSFAPTYNMVVNLIARYDRSRALDLLGASFANHAAQHRIHTLEENLADKHRDLATFEEAARCERGEIWDVYDGSQRLNTEAKVDRSLLVIGAVVRIDGGLFTLANRSWGGGHPKLEFIDERGRKTTLRSSRLPKEAQRVGLLNLPRPVRASDQTYRDEVAALMEAFIPDENPLPLIPAVEGIASCPDFDKHMAWVDRARRTRREIERLERRLVKATGDDIVEAFWSLHGVLTDLGYVDGWSLSPRGESLRRLYNELDLLLAEVLESGALMGLSVPTFAAAISLFTFESRGDDAVSFTPTDFDGVLDTVGVRHASIIDAEHRHGIDQQRVPDSGFVEVIEAWAGGFALDEVFGRDDVGAGDFVRSARQLLDLLRQIRDGFPGYHNLADRAITAIDRGIVAVGGP